MINRVENLDALHAALQAEEVEVDPRREDHDYGRFAWTLDPEGNRVELWEPPNTRVRPASSTRKKSKAKNRRAKSRSVAGTLKQKRSRRRRKSSK